MKILAICGSLKANSSNRSVLKAASILAPSGLAIQLCEVIGSLPHFNPDIEGVDEPQIVQDFRDQVSKADGLLISTPEYAHGIPGSLKNALDWLVSATDFAGKPVALINLAPRAHHAQDALKEVLRTMAANIVEEASFTLSSQRASLDEATILDDAELSSLLAESLLAFQLFLAKQTP